MTMQGCGSLVLRYSFVLLGLDFALSLRAAAGPGRLYKLALVKSTPSRTEQAAFAFDFAFADMGMPRLTYFAT